MTPSTIQSSVNQALPLAISAPPDDTDFGLAQRAAAGERGAFERIMRKNNRTLFRVARAILHDDAEAEDCVQSAYLLAYRALGNFQGDARLSTWLSRIVINEAIGRSRKIARRGVVVPFGNPAEAGSPILELPSETPGPEEEAMRSELRALIERHIDALPDAFRAVFMLRGVEEMTVEETAALLGIPEATVRTRFFRARGALRDAMAHEVDVSTNDAFGFDGARCNRLVAGVMKRIAELGQRSS
jgi:RNA polymerase sigma-70 factor (ECF subfamily)